MAKQTWKVVLQSDSAVMHGNVVADGFKSQSKADRYAALRSGSDLWRYVSQNNIPRRGEA